MHVAGDVEAVGIFEVGGIAVGRERREDQRRIARNLDAVPDDVLRVGAQLLRDRRESAGLSRKALGRLAKLSDSTVKFVETGLHPPSRATLIRLIDVPELKLTWADAPGHPPPPAVRSEPPTTPDERPWLHTQLNCILTPSYDPLAYITQFSRFLNGAGGHIEQSLAYLDPFSAAAYLQICHGHIAVTTLRR